MVGKTIYNLEEKWVGRLYDFVAITDERYPKITAIIIAVGRFRPSLFICPWENLEILDSNEFQLKQKQLLVLSQVVNGILLPFILILMLLLISDKGLMGKYVNGKVFNLIAWITSIIMVV